MASPSKPFEAPPCGLPGKLSVVSISVSAPARVACGLDEAFSVDDAALFLSYGPFVVIILLRLANLQEKYAFSNAERINSIHICSLACYQRHRLQL